MSSSLSSSSSSSSSSSRSGSRSSSSVSCVVLCGVCVVMMMMMMKKARIGKKKSFLPQGRPRLRPFAPPPETRLRVKKPNPMREESERRLRHIERPNPTTATATRFFSDVSDFSAFSDVSDFWMFRFFRFFLDFSFFVVGCS